MFNKAILMGRICNDLDVKTTTNGVTVLSFRLAVDRRFQVKGEERKSDFFNVVAWRATADFISRYFSKGRMILVEGELQTRQYTDKNGSTQNVVELVVDNACFTGEAKAQGTSYGGNAPYQAPQSSQTVNPAPSMSQGEPQDFVGTTATEEDYPF